MLMKQKIFQDPEAALTSYYFQMNSHFSCEFVMLSIMQDTLAVITLVDNFGVFYSLIERTFIVA